MSSQVCVMASLLLLLLGSGEVHGYWKKKASWSTCVSVTDTLYKTDTVLSPYNVYITDTSIHTITHNLEITLVKPVRSTKVIWANVTVYPEEEIITQTDYLTYVAIVHSPASSLLHTIPVTSTLFSQLTSQTLVTRTTTSTAENPYSTVTNTATYLLTDTEYHTTYITQTSTVYGTNMVDGGFSLYTDIYPPTYDVVQDSTSTIQSSVTVYETTTIITSVFSCYPPQTSYMR
ncbi:hypothetical protein Pcinc_031186 [Petrolisthes cinctipes]|uniref:Uncharacterized protein n=1 Tax=Petrolisthes cinctipes TaxID=88211 RepID=A0AAE1EX43_PETCI|nr:hypothetical protein Pcinc_031186 [Petrolisthes cinctipes]